MHLELLSRKHHARHLASVWLMNRLVGVLK
jgi:hypothetical protein